MQSNDPPNAAAQVLVPDQQILVEHRYSSDKDGRLVY